MVMTYSFVSMIKWSLTGPLFCWGIVLQPKVAKDLLWNRYLCQLWTLQQMWDCTIFKKMTDLISLNLPTIKVSNDINFFRSMPRPSWDDRRSITYQPQECLGIDRQIVAPLWSTFVLIWSATWNYCQGDGSGRYI